MPTAASHRPSLPAVLAWLLVALLVWGFVAWVAAGTAVPLVGSAAPSAASTAPLLAGSQAIDAWLAPAGGPGRAFVTRLHSIALHLLASLLLLVLLLRIGATARGAWAGAALFLVHPAVLEPVALAAGRGAVLGGVFSLAALVCLVSAPSQRSGWRRRAWSGAAALAAVAALLSHPLTIVLPGLALLLARPRAAAVYAILLPSLLAGLALALWSGGAPWQLADPGAGLAGLIAAPGRALGQIAWPSLPALGTLPPPWFGALAVLLPALAGHLLRRRLPVLASGCGWLALAILPAALVPPLAGDPTVYLGVAGLGLLLGGLAPDGRLLTLLRAAVVVALAVVTMVFSLRLQSAPALWEPAAGHSPLARAFLAAARAGSVLPSEQRAARALFDEALPALPDDARKLEWMAGQAALLTRLGENEAAAAVAARRCDLAAALRGEAGGEERLLAACLMAAECHSRGGGTAAVARFVDRAAAVDAGHPEVIAALAERDFAALLAAHRDAQGSAAVGQSGWLSAGDAAQQLLVARIERGIERALRRDPQCFRALLLQGRLLVARGSLLSALPVYKAAIAARPERPEPRLLLARLYLDADLLEEAAGCVQEALAAGIDEPQLHYWLSLIHVARGRPADARRYLEAYLRNREGSRDARALLANLLSAEALSAQDQIDVAALAALADRIEALNPDDPKGLLVRAAVLMKQRPRRLVDAIVLLEKAQERLPDSADVQRTLAAAHRDLGWARRLEGKGDGMRHFRRFLELAPPELSTEAVRNVVVKHCEQIEKEGREALLAGDEERALARFEASIDLLADRPDAHFQLGLAHFKSGAWEAARAALDAAIGLGREQGMDVGDYVLPLMDALVRLGRPDEARRRAAGFLAAPGRADPARLEQIRAALAALD